jgi:hypothetical protein
LSVIVPPVTATVGIELVLPLLVSTMATPELVEVHLEASKAVLSDVIIPAFILKSPTCGMLPSMM